MDISELEDIEIEMQHGPESKQERDKRLNQELKDRFDSLNCVGKESDLHNAHAQQEQVIVDTTKLLPLFENKCPNESCAEKSKVLSTTSSVDECCKYLGNVQMTILGTGCPHKCSAKRTAKTSFPQVCYWPLAWYFLEAITTSTCFSVSS
jgi:hypothetical protein